MNPDVDDLIGVHLPGQKVEAWQNKFLELVYGPRKVTPRVPQVARELEGISDESMSISKHNCGAIGPDLPSRQCAIAALLGSETDLDSTVVSRLDRVSIIEWRQLIQESIEAGTISTLLRRLETSAQHANGEHTPEAARRVRSMLQKCLRALMAVTVEQSQLSPARLSELGRFIVAAPGGLELLKKTMIAGADKERDVAFRMILNATASRDVALARQAQSTILRGLSVESPIRIGRLTSDFAGPVSTISARTYIKDTLVEALKEDSQMVFLSLAASAVLNRDMTDLDGAQTIAALGSAAQDGNRQALQVLQSLASKLDAQTPTNDLPHLALSRLIDCATSQTSSHNARPRLLNKLELTLSHSSTVDSAGKVILDLAGSSDYLGEQIWRALRVQSQKQPRLIPLMTAIALENDLQHSTAKGEIDQLPWIIRHGGNRQALRAVEILVSTSQLNNDDFEVVAAGSNLALKQLIESLTEANQASERLLRRIVRGSAGSENCGLVLAKLATAISSEAIRDQFMQVLRKCLRESPREDITGQERLAAALRLVPKSFHKRGSRSGGENANIRYLGRVSTDFLLQSREDSRARLELEAHELGALAHLCPTDKADRVLFARIAANHLVSNSTREYLRSPVRRAFVDTWHELLSKWAPYPTRDIVLRTGRSVGYSEQQWVDIQRELQGLLATALKGKADLNGKEGSIALGVLVGLMLPEGEFFDPIRDRKAIAVMQQDKLLANAAHEAVGTLARSPERQQQILELLVRAEERVPNNTLILKTMAKVVAMMRERPAAILNTLCQRLSTEISDKQNASSHQYTRAYYDALAGAAALHAAAVEIDPKIITAGHDLVGRLLDRLTKERLGPLQWQQLTMTLVGLAPFMKPEQAQVLLQCELAQRVGRRIENGSGRDVFGRRESGLLLLYTRSTEAGPLQLSFGKIVRSLLHSPENDTQLAALRYTSQNWHVVSTPKDTDDYQQLIDRTRTLAASTNTGVRDCARAVLVQAMERDQALCSRMLNSSERAFREMAVQAMYRNGGSGLPTDRAHASCLLSIANDAKCSTETRRHARAFLLTMISPDGLTRTEPLFHQVNALLRNLSQLDLQDLVQDAIYHRNSNKNNDTIAGLTVLAKSDYVKQDVVRALLQGYASSCPVRSNKDESPDQIRKETVLRALQGIAGAFSEADAVRQPSLLELEISSSLNPARVKAALIMLAIVASGRAPQTDTAACERAEQTLIRLCANNRVLEALLSAARQKDSAAKDVVSALVKMSVRLGSDSSNVDEIWAGLVELCKQPLDPQGRLVLYASEAINALKQAGADGNLRAVQALIQISKCDVASARNALEGLAHIVASRPSEDLAAQKAVAHLRRCSGSSILSQAVIAAFKEMSPDLQNRLLATDFTKQILVVAARRELIAGFAGNANSLRSIASISRGTIFENTEAAISSLSSTARTDLDGLALLVAAATRADDQKVRSLAIARLAESAGVVLTASDSQASDGGFRACLESFRIRAMSGSEASIKILIQTAIDSGALPELRKQSMETLRELFTTTHANLAGDLVLRFWRNNPTPAMLAVLAAASAKLPDRGDLQRNLQEGYLNGIRREQSSTDDEYNIRCRASAVAVLSSPECLTPRQIKQLARYMTKPLADTLGRIENLPPEKMRMFLNELRDVCKDPPPGTDSSAVALAIGSLARIATSDDVAAMLQLRECASNSERQVVDRSLFMVAVRALDLRVRANALKSFQSSNDWVSLSEPMKTALSEFATTGRCTDLAELRNACHKLAGESAIYPLAVTLAMYMNVIRPDGSSAPAGERPADRELCQIADRIMTRVQCGDSRTISGLVLPILNAAYQRYGGCSGQPADRQMLLEVMRNLASDGRLTDRRFQDLESVDSDANVRRWLECRRRILDDIAKLTQELGQTPSNLQQANRRYTRMMEAYKAAEERDRRRANEANRRPPLPPKPSESGVRAEQARVIERHSELTNRLADLYGRLGRADKWLQESQTQRTPAEYLQLRAQGRHLDAGAFLLFRWGEGKLPNALKPELERSWHELYRYGYVPTFRMPELETPRQAYDFLARVGQWHKGGKRSGSTTERSLRDNIASALADRCLSGIRAGEFDNAQQRQLLSVAQQFQARSRALFEAFNVAASQDKPERHLSEFVSAELDQLKRMMQSDQVTTLRTNLDTALKNMRASLTDMPTGSIAHQKLSLQISSLETVFNMLDPDSQHMRQLETISRGLKDITPDSKLQQIFSTVAHVVVSTATFAAAAAFCTATFGAGAVAAAACLVLTPVMLTGTNEVTTQVLYTIGGAKRSTPFMDWLFGQTHYDPEIREFRPVTSRQAWQHLGNQLAHEAMMNTVTVGAGSLGRRAMTRTLHSAGYAVPSASGALSGTWWQRFATVYKHGYTPTAHLTGLGLAAPAIANEDLAHAMSVIGPLFAFCHSGWSTYRHAHKVARPTRPAVSRPAELMDHLNLQGLNETQTRELRQWWGFRSSTEQQRIAEAFRFIPPGEDVRILQALRSSSSKLYVLMESVDHYRTKNSGSPAQSACLLREFAALSSRQKRQLLQTLEDLTVPQRQGLVVRLAEAAVRSGLGNSSASLVATEAGPMSRLVRDIVNAGDMQGILVKLLVSLPPNIVADVGTLPLQSSRFCALRTLADPARALAISRVLQHLPESQRTDMLRSLTRIGGDTFRGLAVERVGRHSRVSEIARAIAGLDATQQRQVLELIGTLPESRITDFLNLLTSSGDHANRTSLLRALVTLPPDRRAKAVEAFSRGAASMWRQMCRLNDAQLVECMRRFVPDPSTVPEALAVPSNIRRSPDKIGAWDRALSEFSSSWKDMDWQPGDLVQYWQAKERYQKLLAKRANEIFIEKGSGVDALRLAAQEAASGRGDLGTAYGNYVAEQRALAVHMLVAQTGLKSERIHALLRAKERFDQTVLTRAGQIEQAERISRQEALVKVRGETGGPVADARRTYTQAVTGIGGEEAAGRILSTINRNAGESSLAARVRALDALFQRLARVAGMPPWETRLINFPRGTDGAYEPGTGRIFMPASEALERKGLVRMRKALAHEVTHYEQDMLIIRSLAQELRDARVDVRTTDGMRKLQEIYARVTASRLEADFANRVLRHPSFENARLTPSEIQRARELAAGLKEAKIDGMKITDQANTVGREIVLLWRMSTDQVRQWIDSKTGGDTATYWFGQAERTWLESLKQRLATEPQSRESVIAELSLRMSENLDRLGHEFLQRYKDRLHERLARLQSGESVSIPNAGTLPSSELALSTLARSGKLESINLSGTHRTELKRLKELARVDSGPSAVREAARLRSELIMACLQAGKGLTDRGGQPLLNIDLVFNRDLTTEQLRTYQEMLTSAGTSNTPAELARWKERLGYINEILRLGNSVLHEGAPLADSSVLRDPRMRIDSGELNDQLKAYRAVLAKSISSTPGDAISRAALIREILKSEARNAEGLALHDWSIVLNRAVTHTEEPNLTDYHDLIVAAGKGTLSAGTELRAKFVLRFGEEFGRQFDRLIAPEISSTRIVGTDLWVALHQARVTARLGKELKLGSEFRAAFIDPMFGNGKEPSQLEIAVALGMAQAYERSGLDALHISTALALSPDLRSRFIDPLVRQWSKSPVSAEVRARRIELFNESYKLACESSNGLGLLTADLRRTPITPEEISAFRRRLKDILSSQGSEHTPAKLKEFLHDLLSERNTVDNAQLAQKIMEMRPELRRYLMNPMFGDDRPALVDIQQRVELGRFCDNLAKDGVAMESLLRIPVHQLQEISRDLANMPAYARKHFIDPALRREFNQATYTKALNEVRDFFKKPLTEQRDFIEDHLFGRIEKPLRAEEIRERWYPFHAGWLEMQGLRDSLHSRLSALNGNSTLNRQMPELVHNLLTKLTQGDATSLQLAHNILRLGPEMQERFVVPKGDVNVLKKNVEVGLLYQRLIAEGSVSARDLARTSIANLAEIKPLFEGMSAHLRRYFMDPHLSAAPKMADLMVARQKALEFAQMSEPEQIRHIRRQLEKTSDTQLMQRLERFLSDTQSEHTRLAIQRQLNSLRFTNPETIADPRVRQLVERMQHLEHRMRSTSQEIDRLVPELLVRMREALGGNGDKLFSNLREALLSGDTQSKKNALSLFSIQLERLTSDSGVKSALTLLKNKAAEITNRLATSLGITTVEIEQIARLDPIPRYKKLIDKIKEVYKATGDQPVKDALVDLVNRTSTVDQALKALENLRGRLDQTMETDPKLLKELKTIQEGLFTAPQKPTKVLRDQVPAKPDKLAAMSVEFALTRTELLRRLLQEKVRNSGYPFDVSEDSHGNLLLTTPARLNGARRTIKVPVNRALGPEIGHPLTLELFGLDGRAHRLTLPATAHPRFDGNNPLEPNAVMFRVSQSDGTVIEHRIMRPSDKTAEYGVNYVNGYVRSNRILQINDKGTMRDLIWQRKDGTQRAVEVPLSPELYARLGIDAGSVGNPWVVVQVEKSRYEVVHIETVKKVDALIAGGTGPVKLPSFEEHCPASLRGRRLHLNNLLTLYQGSTHYHIIP